MEKSFVDILMHKILERQQLDARPMGQLDPAALPSEMMQLQLLTRARKSSAWSSAKPHQTPYKRIVKKRASPSSALPPAALKTESAKPNRPVPHKAMGALELLAGEVFKRLGEPLPANPLPREIAKAYRRLAFQHHPDRAPDASAFHQLTEAHQTLRSWADQAYPGL